MRFDNGGQTLLEIIVAVGVAVLLVTGLVVSTTVSVRTSQYSERRSLAVKYAQEGIEIVRSLRDSNDWSDFTAYDPNGSGVTAWYLDQDDMLESTLFPVEENPNIDDVFTRAVVFDWDGSSQQLAVTSVVLWREGSQIRDVTLDTIFAERQ